MPVEPPLASPATRELRLVNSTEQAPVLRGSFRLEQEHGQEEPGGKEPSCADESRGEASFPPSPLPPPSLVPGLAW